MSKKGRGDYRGGGWGSVWDRKNAGVIADYKIEGGLRSGVGGGRNKSERSWTHDQVLLGTSKWGFREKVLLSIQFIWRG